MLIIPTEAASLHVRCEGPEDGRAVMFANSLGTDLRVWDPLIPHLPAGLRLVRYDKRGHGLSDCPPGPYRIEDLAGEAAAVADALGLRDVVFVGLSIGGLIGQGLALARPDVVAALVLMDTAAKIGTPATWAERIAAVEAGGIEAIADGVLDRWFTPPLRRDPVALAPWRNMLTRTPRAGYVGCCAAIAAADFTDRIGALSIPVMAMAGDADQATPPDLVRATAALCGAPFHVIDKAGHLPGVERPAETARLLADFLERTAHD
jgi:3-oxoadipate enol-lactonase